MVPNRYRVTFPTGTARRSLILHHSSRAYDIWYLYTVTAINGASYTVFSHPRCTLHCLLVPPTSGDLYTVTA